MISTGTEKGCIIYLCCTHGHNINSTMNRHISIKLKIKDKMQKFLEKYIPKITQNKYLLYIQQANSTKFYEMSNSNLIQA